MRVERQYSQTARIDIDDLNSTGAPQDGQATEAMALVGGSSTISQTGVRAGFNEPFDTGHGQVIFFRSSAFLASNSSFVNTPFVIRSCSFSITDMTSVTDCPG